MTPGAELRQIREDLGVSQAEWARLLGFADASGRQHISKIESDKVPASDTVMRLARMYQRHGIDAAEQH